MHVFEAMEAEEKSALLNERAYWFWNMVLEQKALISLWMQIKEVDTFQKIKWEWKWSKVLKENQKPW